MSTIAHYIQCFDKLHTEKNAPHKPILLLSVFSLFYHQQQLSEIIEITPALKTTFKKQWQLYVDSESSWICDWKMPYYHMQSEPFWHLDERAKKTETSLKEYPAIIDDDLVRLCRNPYTCRAMYAFVLNRYLLQNDLG